MNSYMKTNLLFLVVLILSCSLSVKSLTRNLGRTEKYETSLGLYVQKVYNNIPNFNSMLENINPGLDENFITPSDIFDYSTFIIHGI